MQNYIFIETYGCSANQNNSEIIKGTLRQAGYQLTNNEKIADIIIINTCIVKGKTESKIKRRIQDLARTYSDKLMIIAGCMPETDKTLKKLNPRLIELGTHHTKDIVKLIKDFNENSLTKQRQESYLSKQNEEKICLPKISNNKFISITQISEGCLGSCNFCQARLAKGTLFSYDKNKIIKSIESDLQAGAKEIWLTSQDCASYGLDRAISREDASQKPLGVWDKDNASYGLDRDKQELPELLKQILSLKHNFKLRLGMMNPNNLAQIQDEILNLYSSQKMYKFLHIPIQSASNKILKDMNRPYKIETAQEIIKKFKKQFPDITIATDIIVGYPTETEQDHKLNLEFIKQFKPDVLNLSKFSSHKNTPAGKLIPLDIEIINKRTAELMELHRTYAEQNKQKYKDKTINVFVNSKTKIPNTYEARDENYNIVLINSKDKSVLGKNISVKIKKIGVHHMIGEIIHP